MTRERKKSTVAVIVIVIILLVAGYIEVKAGEWIVPVPKKVTPAVPDRGDVLRQQQKQQKIEEWTRGVPRRYNRDTLFMIPESRLGEPYKGNRMIHCSTTYSGDTFCIEL